MRTSNRKKRLLAILLALVMAVTTLPMGVSVRADEVKTEDGNLGTESGGITPEVFAGGDGTEQNPYLISSAAQMKYFETQVNAGETYEGKYIKLSSDIDLTGIAWTPIGGGAAVTEGIKENNVVYDVATPTYKFKGTFDGNGKTIKNLKIDADSNFVGLFGYNGGIIKNFTLEGEITVTKEHDYVGGIAGFNAGKITRVINKAVINAPDCYNVGGIAGLNTTGNWKDGNEKQYTVKNAIGVISECGNEAKLTAMRTLGGIVGGNYGEIDSCYNYGDIDFWWEGSMSKIGGIAGVCADTGNATFAPGHISNCYNTGDINWINTVQTSRGYGGIVCFIGPTSSITNCYSIGALKIGRSDHTPICPRYDKDIYIKNNYSLDTIQIKYPEDLKNVSMSGYQRSEAQFKSEDFLGEIGGSYAKDVNNLNNGYPVLKWQNDAAFTMTGVEADTTELTFVEGQSFDVTRIKLYACFSDGTKSYIPSHKYTVSKTDSFTKKDDGTTVSVGYEMNGEKKSVSVKIKVETKELDYVRITSLPTKDTYNVGDVFVSDGMQVRAYYSNELLTGTEKYETITNYQCAVPRAFTAKNKTVTVTYTLNGVTRADSVAMTVVDAGTTPEKDENGVYQLATAADLTWFSKQVNYFGNTDIDACLTADITAGSDFEPVGNASSVNVTTASGGTIYSSKSYKYAGTFDGNGHTITAKISMESAKVALFRYTNGASIKNLTLNGTITGTSDVAGFVSIGTNTTISNCTNNATITATTTNAGGIASNLSGKVWNCKNTGTISGTRYVAGIYGSNGAEVVDCINEGEIISTGYYVGGLVANLTANMTNSYNTGKVTGTYYVGGLAGNALSTTIKDSYNTGDVIATAATNNKAVGGIIGNKNNYSKILITGCYNTGSVAYTGTTANAAVGEIVGYVGSGNAANTLTIEDTCYLQGEGKVSIGNVVNETNKNYITDNSQAKTKEEIEANFVMDQTAVGKVMRAINAIGKVQLTSASKVLIQEARKAYDALDATEQEQVTNYQTLETAEKTYAELKETAATKALVDNVVAKINKIGTVTLDSKATIDEAKAAYEALTEKQKESVTNYETLTKAEAEYIKLKATADKTAADKEAADQVVKQINALTGKTLTRENVAAARTAYDALTEDQKALVGNVELLDAVEAVYKEAEAEKVNPSDVSAAAKVIAKINNIGTVDLTKATAIREARAAYSKLTDVQKKYVEEEIAILTSAESKLAAQQKATEKGKTVTVGKGVYKVTKASVTAGTLEYVKPAKKTYTSISVPNTVTIYGATYKVTSIASKAFDGCKATKITLGANVATIRANAFKNCTKLKTLTINNKKMTTKTVYAKAFTGLTKKTTIKVPASKKAAYKKLFVKKGLSKKVTIK